MKIYFLLLMSTMTTMISIMFSTMNHPLSMGLTLLVQTIIICLTTAICSKITWFSYILFLVFLGAMLILFIYVASLASNELMKMSTTLLLTVLLLTPAVVVILVLDPLTIMYNSMVSPSLLQSDQFLNFTEYKINNLYNPSTMNLTMFVIVYLLLTLIVVVKISSSFFGPLRTN